MSMIVDFDVKTDPNTDLILTQLRETPAAIAAAGGCEQLRRHRAKVPLRAADAGRLNSPHSTYDAQFLANYAYINLSDQLTRVPGIGSVQVFGAGQYAMRIWVKPDQLAKLDITVPEIVSAHPARTPSIRPARWAAARRRRARNSPTPCWRKGGCTSPEEFGQIVVRETPDGAIVRLKDVARMELGAQDYSIVGPPQRQARAHHRRVPTARLQRRRCRQRREQTDGRTEEALPAGRGLRHPARHHAAVTEGMREIVKTLVTPLLLVMLVVYIFLQGWRATLIPLLAVPVSLIGTFVFFPVFGFSINTLSLFGLVLAIGLVVDDAIVVVEAVEHHIEEGMAPKEAALKAMEEVSGPVVGIALVLSAVFATVFIPGITGRLYQQFAVTIAISVIISAFNALSLSPALAALLLKPKKDSHGLLRRFFTWFNRMFGKPRMVMCDVGRAAAQERDCARSSGGVRGRRPVSSPEKYRQLSAG